MKVKVISLDDKAAGEQELDESIFGLEPREDILHRVVQWQLAKRRAGTHKTKGISEISGTTKKPFKQKGTGRARQGSLRSPQMRGGAVIFGPVVRSHEYSLPKKVRALGLKIALSAKQKAGQLHILADDNVKDAKTAKLAQSFGKLGLTSALIIGGETLNEGFARAARNLKGIDVLPQQGINVYDILAHQDLVLTKDAVKSLEARLK